VGQEGGNLTKPRKGKIKNANTQGEERLREVRGSKRERGKPRTGK